MNGIEVQFDRAVYSHTAGMMNQIIETILNRNKPKKQETAVEEKKSTTPIKPNPNSSPDKDMGEECKDEEGLGMS